MIQRLKSTIRTGLRAIGYEIIPLRTNGYIDARETVKAAHERGITVGEYVELMWNQAGRTERIIEEMKKVRCFVSCDRVCEIGPGTGRYLERVIQEATPTHYDIYETQEDWAKWLAGAYPTISRQPADGHTLRGTARSSCNLVHAHGVFVYLKLLHAFEYFLEMIRICAPNGYIAFDFFSEEEFPRDVIEEWLGTGGQYPVVLPYKSVLEFFNSRGFKLSHEFTERSSYQHSHSFSRYMIFHNHG